MEWASRSEQGVGTRLRRAWLTSFKLYCLYWPQRLNMQLVHIPVLGFGPLGMLVLPRGLDLDHFGVERR